MPNVRNWLNGLYVLTECILRAYFLGPSMKNLTNSIFSRIFMAVFPTCLLAILVCSAIAYRALDKSVERNTMRLLSDSVLLLSANIDAGVPVGNLSKIIGKFAGESGIRTTIIDRAGKVVLDSVADDSTMLNHLDRVEVKEALSGKTYQCLRYSQTLRAKFIYVSAPAGKGGDSEPLYCVRQSMNLKLLDAQRGIFSRQIAIFAFAATALALLISLYTARKISAPLISLANAATHYANGNFEAVITDCSISEIHELSRALYGMGKDLQKRISSLYKRNCELDEVFSQMRDCVFICSDDGEVRRYNKSCSEIFDIPANVHNPRVVGPFRNSAIISAVEKTFKSKDSVVVEFEHFGKIYRLTGIPLAYASKHARALFVIRDISKDRQTEMLRREFVAGASHELKTPITAIKMAAETISENFDAETVKRFLSTIEDEADRMAALVNDMLLLSKVEFSDAGENFVKFNIVDVLKIAVSDNENLIHSNGDSVEFDCPETVEVMGEPKLAEIAIGNLVSNASRYGGKNCKIKLAVKESGKMVEVSVSDTGMGISKENQARVFERFFRVDKGRSRALGGTGLGLALVKHIAILHGGTVSLESQLGKGSTFTITFKKA